MKKILLLLIVISLTSCSKKFDLDQLPQEWKLVTIIATRLVPSIATEPQIIWQETYSLNSNGTFTKTRNRDGIITTASGTFAFKDSSNDKFLELTFETGFSLISSCTPGKEIMWVRSESKMQGTWDACDGMRFDYERIK